MTLTAQQLNDLTAMTQRRLGEPNYTEIATDIQEFTVLEKIIRENKVEFQDGTGVQWDVMVAHAGTAENVGLMEEDGEMGIPDTMVQAQADWRNTVDHYAIEGREISMNRGESRIVNLVTQREHSTMISLAEKFEDNWWGPPVALSDAVTPWGINTWLVKNASEGFYGGAPSGYTSIGLNPTTYSRWKNYTFQYGEIAKDDLIRKWRKAAVFTKFKPPMGGNPSFNTGDKYAYYTNYSVVGRCEELLEEQNDNLGPDVASMDGQLLFRRAPVMWVPKLEADTTDPIYGINWGWVKVIVLQDWWLRRTLVPVYPGQHTVSATFLDSTYQFVFYNRRAHFVGATGTTYPS